MPHAADPTNDSEETADRQPVSPEQAHRFVSEILRLSWRWTAAMIIVAILASVHVERPASGGVSVSLAVGTVALAAFALIWLPPVVRLLSLTGGGFKAFGFEASTGGLGNAPDALIAGLARIRWAATEVEQVTSSATGPTHAVRAAVDDIASEYLGGAAAVTWEALSALGRRYEHTRAAEPPSPERAIGMNLLLNEARVRARASPELAARMGRELLGADADGDRIIGLALLQQAPIADALADILRVFSSARSAFEQYHSAVAVEAVAPLLSVEQRETAIRVLRHEQSDPRNVGLNQDPYIPSAIDSALAALGFDEV